VKHASYEAPHYAFFSLPSSPPTSKCSPQHPVPKIFYLCSSLSVRDPVSHPYKTMGNIIVLYILIFKCSEGKRVKKKTLNRMVAVYIVNTRFLEVY
jgi:hypothetical protein